MRSQISPIKYSLEKLNIIEKYIVNIIYLNEGKMDLILLTQLVTDYKDQYLVITHQMVSDNLIQLEEKHIISKVSTNVEIAHDSIILELEKQSHNPTLAAAYRLLINFYNVQKKQNTHDYSNINKLFMLYLKFHDESIISILDDIKKMIIQYKYPQQILSKLVYLRDKLSEKQNPNIKISDEISLTLLEVSYQMELGQFAQEALDTIYDPRNTLHRIYFVGLMALNSSDSEVHSKIKKLIEKERFGSRSRLVMELMLLSSMMESESLDESKAFAQKMLSVDSYKEYMEFSLLLRNYAELVELKESLIIYQYCLEVLGSFNRKDLQAQIYISIAMCHSYLGQLDSAKNDIKMAIELSEGSVKENMILNNSAVIDMLSGSFSEQVLKNLQDALLLTANQYESILVKCNILVWHTVNHNYEVAQKICTEIEESKYSNYNYEEFLHIVYTNLCFYYQQIDNSEYLVYSKKIESLEHLRGRNLNPYIVVTPYRIDFLGYWNIEVSRDLQNS
ncbi:hypothetical protein Q0F98_33215 [Paenibacillus amylolyticus]|nr:hypothetical protein Q0F98_33215 [Paenibacillus amylolyticus]